MWRHQASRCLFESQPLEETLLTPLGGHFFFVLAVLSSVVSHRGKILPKVRAQWFGAGTPRGQWSWPFHESRRFYRRRQRRSSGSGIAGAWHSSLESGGFFGGGAVRPVVAAEGQRSSRTVGLFCLAPCHHLGCSWQRHITTRCTLTG